MSDEKADEPKISKYEQNQNFLKELDDKIQKQKEVEAKIQALVERNEEIAARNLLGGKTESVPHVNEKKEESPQEYAKRLASGKWTPNEYLKE